MRQNQAGFQNRIKQFRGRVGQRLVGKTKLKASSRRRFFNGVSPLNRDNVEYTQPTYTQYHTRNARQNRFFQQRGIQFSQNQSSQRGYHQKQQTRGRGWNVGARPSSGHVAERRKQDTSFQTGPIVRGRLRSNFGFMRSDTIVQKQQLKQDLQNLQLQQQQQWVQKSWQRLKTKIPQQMQSNSARTAVYEPSSGASVTIQIPNIVDSTSDVSVSFGKKSKRNRQNDVFARSVALQQPPEASRLTSVKFGNRRSQSVVSFEEDFDVNVETASSSPINSSPFHLVSRKLSTSTEDVDCSILIV